VVTPYTEIPYLISLAGFQVAVKAVTASFIQRSYTWIEAGVDEIPYTLAKGSFHYTFQSRKLPSGLFQTVIFPKSIIEPPVDKVVSSSIFFVQMTPAITESDIATQFLAHYAKNTDIPLHESWALPLWEIFSKDDFGFLDPLDTLVGDINGYLVQHSDWKLTDIITEKLKAENPAFADCFKEK
jgi:hypothetical protein